MMRFRGLPDSKSSWFEFFKVSFLLTVLLTFPAASASSFLFKTHPKKGEVVLVQETDYILLYQCTARTEKRETASGKKKKWREISYKLTSRAADLPALFGPAQEGHIEFTDKDGFTVESALVRREDFQAGGEYYGFLWAEEKRARKIHWARFRVSKIASPAGQIPPESADINQGQDPPAMAPPPPAAPPHDKSGSGGTGIQDPFARKGITAEEVTESLKEIENKKGMDLGALFKEGPSLQEMVKKEVQKQGE